jgi:hypothetical protein
VTAGEVFTRFTAALDRVGIPYMLTGSFASAYFGATRSTQDIDLVIEATPAKLEALRHGLPQNEYYVDFDALLEAHKQQSLFNVIDLRTGWKIDLIFRKSRPFSLEEFRRRQQVEVHGVNLFVATAEDVILSKLEWSKLSKSQRQLEDVVAILRSRLDRLDRLYLKKWIAALQLEAQWKSAIKKAGLANQ